MAHGDFEAVRRLSVPDDYLGTRQTWRLSPPELPVVLAFTKLHPEALAPHRATPGATGWDLYACLPDGPVEVGYRPEFIPTGIAVAVPEGYDLQLRGRSGLAAEGVMTHPGTIDSDYRGEIVVLLYNVYGEYTVQHGDRIAQLVLTPAPKAVWHEAQELPESARGAGGFGSTGR
jgi:dUTP pyrophosphatase